MSKENSEEVAQEGGGDGAKKDDMYENRGSKKLIRLVTVMAYMFSVSFVAIVLSAYYLFLWEPPNPRLLRKPVPMSSEPEVQFLISEEMTLRNESKMDFVPRVSSRQNLIGDPDRERMHRRKMNESLFLLRNSLIEFLYDRINDSRPTDGKRTANSAPEKEKGFDSTGKLSERGTRHSSEIMSRVFNGGASVTLESSTISGGETNNDRFTSTRSTYAYQPPRNIPPSDLTIASNDPPSIDSSRDSPRFIDRLKNAPRSNETPARLANVALNLKEAQIERTTTSPAMESEDPLPELATAQPQKDFLTILTEIVNATSSSLPSSISEDLQTDSSVEIKETSTKMHSMIT